MTTLITTLITWLSLLTGAPGPGDDIDCGAMAPDDAEPICMPADEPPPIVGTPHQVTEISNGF